MHLHTDVTLLTSLKIVCLSCLAPLAFLGKICYIKWHLRLIDPT